MSCPVVKVCGVTTEHEVDELATLGVDYFGLVVARGFPWTILPERAKQLAARRSGLIRPTLIAPPSSTADLEELIVGTGVLAVQLGVLSLPTHVARLRRRFRREELTVLQTVPYRDERFVNEQFVDDYLAAGADFILLDRFEKAGAADAISAGPIPEESLIGFRHRHLGKPILIAGGVSAANAASLVAASGAAGVDVCSSVRRDGRIQGELVARLLVGIDARTSESRWPRPSLRECLGEVESGDQIIAYLTIGDPPGRFLEVADELLAAGALTLELGLPCSNPKEGSTLKASHRRALEAGVDTPTALAMLRAVARSHPRTPLITVVHWGCVGGQSAQEQVLDELADAGASAILPVGLALWELPTLAASADRRGLETVFACPPDASPKYRSIVFRYCSGAIYVPRGRMTGGSAQFGNVAEFCHRVAAESELPMIVGVGVTTREDVVDICRTPAKAAAVGSLLVDHIARGGSAGDFLRRLGASEPNRRLET